MKEFNYSTILNIYTDNLINKLRDFKVNDDLALWVPDENINLSVLNLLDSVDENEIQITFNKNQFKKIDSKQIINSLKDEGEITLNKISYFLKFKRLSKNKKIILNTIKKKKVSKKINKKINLKDQDALINKNYLSNLKLIKIPNNFSKKILNSSSLIKLKFQDEKFNIEILVNPRNHIVIDGFLEIKKKEKNTEINKFALYLLNSMINLPINEIKDHLLIKLEYHLRPKKFEKNQGIILKNRGGKIFIYFQSIINEFYSKYIKKIMLILVLIFTITRFLIFGKILNKKIKLIK